MFNSIGITELYYIAFVALIGLLILFINKRKTQFGFSTVGNIFLGISAILFLSALFTPPDLFSNLILSVPAIIIFTVIMIKKHKK